MTPPLNDVISPTGQRVYTDITCSFPPRTPAGEPNLALKALVERTVETYYAQLEHIEALAAKSAASRRAFLTAAYAGETK